MDRLPVVRFDGDDEFSQQGQLVVWTRVQGDTHNRFELLANGEIYVGDGVSPPVLFVGVGGGSTSLKDEGSTVVASLASLDVQGAGAFAESLGSGAGRLVVAGVDRGVAGARPAASADVAHLLYIASDTGTVSYCDGASWFDVAAGAPADASYLVASDSATLPNDVIVGVTPGGELGGTWASPTVDATHSGSSHADVEANAAADAAAQIAAETTYLEWDGTANPSGSPFALDGTERNIIQVGSLTVTAYIQLPPASSMSPGAPIRIADGSNSVTGSKLIVISTQGGDTMKNAFFAGASWIAVPSGGKIFVSDGVSEWTQTSGSAHHIDPTTSLAAVDSSVPTSNAVKTYVDNSISDLADLAGSARVDITPPSGGIMTVFRNYTRSAWAANGGAKAVAATDEFISQTDTMSGDPNNVNLIAANSVPAGWPLTIHDDSGSCSPSHRIVAVPNGSDTISPASAATLQRAYATLVLVSNGSNGWVALPAPVMVADIGSTVQAYDADLAAIAALPTTSFGRSVLTQADAAAVRTLISAQLAYAALTEIGGLSPSNDDVLHRKAGVWTNRTLAQFMTDLGLTAGFETAVRANTLNQMAAPTATLSMNSQRLSSLAAGILAADAARLDQTNAFVQEANNWTRTGAQTFTQAADTTAYMKPGTKLRWAESSVTKYGVVKTAVFATGTTTVTMITNTDYVLNATPDANSMYYAGPGALPIGFPPRFAYSPSVNIGFSANPTHFACWWSVHAGFATVNVFILAAGVSNSTLYKYDAPIDAAALTYSFGTGVASDNSVPLAAGQVATVYAVGNLITCQKQGGVDASWTNVNGKSCSFTIRYPVG